MINMNYEYLNIEYFNPDAIHACRPSGISDVISESKSAAIFPVTVCEYQFRKSSKLFLKIHKMKQKTLKIRK